MIIDQILGFPMNTYHHSASKKGTEIEFLNSFSCRDFWHKLNYFKWVKVMLPYIVGGGLPVVRGGGSVMTHTAGSVTTKVFRVFFFSKFFCVKF
jgi:hypothetical protein